MANEMAKESRMTPTDETKEIAGYNCRKYIVTMMGMTVTTTLQKIEKRSLSGDLFKVSAGYKLIEIKMPMQ
jgi:hypothetical protein